MNKKNKTKKNICIILPGKLPVPNINGGAIETLMTILINQNEIHEKAHFIVISAWAEGVEEIANKYKNTEFHYIKIRNGVIKKAINFINYIIAITIGNIDFFKSPFHYDIEKEMKNINADVVVVEHGVYKHFEFLRKNYSRDQLYLHIHGTGLMPNKQTCKTFGHIITVSEFVKKLYIDSFNGYDTQFHVCLNGIDDKNFKKHITKEIRDEIRKNFGVSYNDFLVIYCGRLVPEKGVKELIKGVINTKNEHIKLMIVGSSNFKDGKMTDYVRKLINMIENHKEQIFFTGYVPNQMLYKYYQVADIQVICSICEEAAGLVAIEGMLSGLPLIVTNSGGISEYVDTTRCVVLDKYNALTCEADSERLSMEMANALNKEYMKYNKQGIDNISNAEKFNGENFYKRFLEIVG